MSTTKRSFLPLYVTNFLGTLNDNFLKTLASFTVIAWLPDERLKSLAMGLTAGALVLPYILCSPLADRFTALWRKRTIVRLAKWAELPIIAVAIAGFAAHAPFIVIGSVLLMGLQSSLYSPAKYALVRDIGGEARISSGMGGMEGVSFLGVLVGTVAGAIVADLSPSCAHVKYVLLALFATLGLLASYTIKADEELNHALHAINPLRYLRRVSRMAKRYDGLAAVILTLSVFWWAAAMLQMGLLVYGETVLKLSAKGTGALLCCAAVGIVAGQILAGLIDRKYALLNLAPVTGWIAAILFAVLAFIPLSPAAFGLALGLLAFDMGFFKLPFDAEIQKIVKGPRLNTILSYFNQVSFLFMLAASGCYTLVSWLFGPRAFFVLLSVAMFIAPLMFILCYRRVLLSVARWIFARRYHLRLTGQELLDQVAQDPAPLLVLPNHPAMVDPMLVGTVFYRTPLKPLSDESFFKTGFLAPRVLKTLGAVPVPDLRKKMTRHGASLARCLTDIVKSALASDASVIFYPSGHIQTEPDREDIGTRQLAYNICRDLPPSVRVIGVRTHGLWGSIWSRAGRNASPAFVPTLVKSIFLWFFWSPFVRRREVTMEICDITEHVRAWSRKTRLEFNAALNAWYNEQPRNPR
jgi:acyl-[acyl-carrier-protein]-phospholipid O-acyltransferase/long-chain-fatty-acid--[acyl-carrier-protein] ligase